MHLDKIVYSKSDQKKAAFYEGCSKSFKTAALILLIVDIFPIF